MVAHFSTSFDFSFPWPTQVYAALNKYSDNNPLAPHVISIDVVDRTFLPDGTLRSERLIGVQQDSPRWVSRLLNTPEVTYVREVSFIVPSSLAPTDDTAHNLNELQILREPPKLLLASTNLTMSSLLQCRESISYLPHPWPYAPSQNADQNHPLSHESMPSKTLFTQSALIFSTGLLATAPYPPVGISPLSPVAPHSFPSATTFPQRTAGGKIEKWSKSRFATNAETGRNAMIWAARKILNSPDETQKA